MKIFLFISIIFFLSILLLFALAPNQLKIFKVFKISIEDKENDVLKIFKDNKLVHYEWVGTWGDLDPNSDPNSDPNEVVGYDLIVIDPDKKYAIEVGFNIDPKLNEKMKLQSKKSRSLVITDMSIIEDIEKYNSVGKADRDKFKKVNIKSFYIFNGKIVK